MKTIGIVSLSQTNLETFSLLASEIIARILNKQVIVLALGDSMKSVIDNSTLSGQNFAVAGSASELLSLLEKEVISLQDIPRYCYKLTETVQLLDYQDGLLNESHKRDILNTMMAAGIDSQPVIVWIEPGTDRYRLQEIAEKCDKLFFIVDHNVMEYQNVRDYMELNEIDKEKTALFIVNYNKHAGSIKMASSITGLPLNSTMYLTYNPYLLNVITRGAINKMLSVILSGDKLFTINLMDCRIHSQKMAKLLGVPEDKTLWKTGGD